MISFLLLPFYFIISRRLLTTDKDIYSLKKESKNVFEFDFLALLIYLQHAILWVPTR